MWYAWSQDKWPKYAGSVYRIPIDGFDNMMPFLAVPDAVLDPVDATPTIVIPPKKRSFLESIFAPSPLPSPPPPVPKRSPLVRNFAFQLQIKRPNSQIRAGLIFRSDSAKQAYYCFSIEKKKFSLSTLGSSPIVEDESDAIHEDKPNLLAVVVQEATLYLYINLHLVEAVKDTSLLHEGMVGITIYAPYRGYDIVEFSYAKVWVKE